MFGHRVAVMLRVPVPVPARLPPPTAFLSHHELPGRMRFRAARRCYATPGRPRSVVGEPSSTVKRAAKRSAAKATSSTSPAKQKVEAKKGDAATEKKKKTKKAAVPKKKAAKKELTEAQKAVKAAKSENVKTRDLKTAALKPPKVQSANAFTQFVSDKYKGNNSSKGGSPAEIKQNLAEMGKAMGVAWKELSPADIEHYNHLAHSAREQSQAEYRRWLESYTVEQIAAANRARASLRRKTPQEKKTLSKWPVINDERRAKRPVTAFVQFSTNRQASGDFRNLRLPERMRLIAQEWKALNEDEKKKYQELHKQDLKRYDEERDSVYGQPPPHAQRPATTAAAAA